MAAGSIVLLIEVRALFEKGLVRRLDYLAPLLSLCRSDLTGVTAADSKLFGSSGGVCTSIH